MSTAQYRAIARGLGQGMEIPIVGSTTVRARRVAVPIRRHVDLGAEGELMIAAPVRPTELRTMPQYPELERRTRGPRIRVQRRPLRVDVSLGQAPDPSDPSAVPVDVPEEWLTSFVPPTAEQVSEASADASSWERFVDDYTTRCGLAYAKLRANLAAYLADFYRKRTALHAIATDANYPRDVRLSYANALSTCIAAEIPVREEFDKLQAVARGEAVIAFDVAGWQFAIVPIGDLPPDAPPPVSVPVPNPIPVVVIVSVVGLLIAGGAIAWWAASAATAEPARVDADARRKLSEAQAQLYLAQRDLAMAASELGDDRTATAILSTARQSFQSDVHALTEPDYARAQAEAAKAAGGESIGDLLKLGVGAMVLMKVLERA
jgi:hypothetical protein